MIRGWFRRNVAKQQGKLVEFHDLVLSSNDPDERMDLEMFKARATKHPIFVMPTEAGEAVLRIVKVL